LGQVLTQGGYEVVFVDVDSPLVDRLNAAKSYPLRLLSDTGEIELMISPVRAVHADRVDAVAREIADADLMGTSVGAGVLRFVVPSLAAGLRRRWAEGNHKPIDILLCENLMHVDAVVRDLLKAELTGIGELQRLEESVGLVETSIGRMVPVPSEATQRGNPLRVCAEPYAQLPVDAAAFRGPVPQVPGLVASSPFRYYVERKLFVHNLGHAVAAYLGAALGYTFVWEAAADPLVYHLARTAMFQSVAALAREHGAPAQELRDHALDLLRRFGNRRLGDTLERVCKDPRRKLAPDDRLVGALNLCRRHQVDFSGIALGVAAAAVFLSHHEANLDVRALLLGPCGLDAASIEFHQILGFVTGLTEPRPLEFLALLIDTKAVLEPQ
jgi:mannitol-1-phosphate 5-dehydrogenase